MQHVFISYVSENLEIVNKLHQELVSRGIKVWLDVNDIAPGSRWKQAIRNAIREGTFFTACFSKEYNKRDKTYMNEELTIAIDELRQRPTDRVWFIPIKLNECEIPDRDIGGGETLNDLQHLKLYENWDAGIQRIVKIIQPESLYTASRDRSATSVVEKDTTEYALLISEDGKPYFIPFQNVHWNSTGISLELLPESSEKTAFLRSLRRHISEAFARDIFIALALREDAAWVSPQEIVETTSGSQIVWKVVFKEKRHRQNESPLGELTFGSFTPEKIAVERAKRILLNKKLGELPPDFQNRTGTVGLLNEATLEMHVRGVNGFQISASPIPPLYRSFGNRQGQFEKFARLTSILYLKLSNTVEEILQFDLKLLNSNQVEVKFKGRRRKRFISEEPYIFEVNGICQLSE